MTARTSVEKKSVGPNKRASKRAPPPKELRARSSRLTRDFQLDGDDARAPPLGSTAPLAERVQALRGQLFKAISIVECCKFATATLLVVDDAEYMVPAFEAICDLIDTSAEELEKIASECASAA